MNLYFYIYFLSSLVYSYFSFRFFDRRQIFEVRPTNVTVVKGQTAILRCTVCNQAQIGATLWLQNGLLLGFDYELSGYDRYRVIGNHTRGEYHLEINDVKTQLIDDAIYECQVAPPPLPTTNLEEEGLRATAHLNVLVPPDMVVLDGYRSGDVVEVRSGKSVDISCRATGAKPASEMVWYRSENGRSMPIPDNFVHISENCQDDGRVTSVAHLRFAINATDNGSVFVCQVHHEALPESHSLRANFSLSVIFPSHQPSIQGYGGRRLKAGERYVLVYTVKNDNLYPELILYNTKQALLVDDTFTKNREIKRNDYDWTVQYMWKASTSHSTTLLSASVTLKAMYFPSKIQVTVTGLSEGKIVDKVQLITCVTSQSKTTTKFFWAFDGLVINDHLRLKIHGLITSSMIVVELIEKQKVIFVCTPFNEEEIGLSSFNGDGQVKDAKVIKVHSQCYA